MDKGIRPEANRIFGEHIAKLQKGEVDIKKFRSVVCKAIEDAFAGSIKGGAGGHYNTALKEMRQKFPDLVAGIGRPPEKNNGGRKKKAKPEVVVVAPMLMLGYTAPTTEVNETVAETLEALGGEAAAVVDALHEIEAQTQVAGEEQEPEHVEAAPEAAAEVAPATKKRVRNKKAA